MTLKIDQIITLNYEAWGMCRSLFHNQLAQASPMEQTDHTEAQGYKTW